MPGLREWGSGLETLTECYLKYIEKYIVEVGRVFQRQKEISHRHKQMNVHYPYDIDLIAVNPSKNEVVLVSCSEEWEKNIEETDGEFADYGRVLREHDGLGFGKDFTIKKRIACVKVVPKRNRQEFLEKGIEVMDTELMIGELLKMIKSQKAEGRKGVRLEPLLWILQTLYYMGKIHV